MLSFSVYLINSPLNISGVSIHFLQDHADFHQSYDLIVAQTCLVLINFAEILFNNFLVYLKEENIILELLECVVASANGLQEMHIAKRSVP